MRFILISGARESDFDLEITRLLERLLCPSKGNQRGIYLLNFGHRCFPAEPSLNNGFDKSPDDLRI